MKYKVHAHFSIFFFTSVLEQIKILHLLFLSELADLSLELRSHTNLGSFPVFCFVFIKYHGHSLLERAKK